jgi:hypothetical protein
MTELTTVSDPSLRRAKTPGAKVTVAGRSVQVLRRVEHPAESSVRNRAWRG